MKGHVSHNLLLELQSSVDSNETISTVNESVSGVSISKQKSKTSRKKKDGVTFKGSGLLKQKCVNGEIVLSEREFVKQQIIILLHMVLKYAIERDQMQKKEY